MSSHTPKLLAVLSTAGLMLAASPGAASADSYGCTASAVTAKVLGQMLEPVRAGSADACTDSTQILDVLGNPLAGDSASARTGMAGETATAATALSGFRAGALSALTPELPQIPLPAGLDALAVPLPASLQLLGLPSLLTVDATHAARKLTSIRSLADVPLVAADLVQTGVTAACTAGRSVLDAVANVKNLTALGQLLTPDKAIDTAVPLSPAQVVDFGDLDVAAIELPAGLSLATPVTGPLLRAALQSVVAGLPTVSVPEALGRVRIDPAERRGDGNDALRQLGPRVRVDVLGREVADVTLGDALVSVLGAVCGIAEASPKAAGAPVAVPDLSPSTELALSCAPGGVVLTDVVEKDGKVKLVGVAAEQFVGRAIDLVLTHTGKSVVEAVVQPDGSFRARAPLPSNKIRWTNKARYQAVAGEQRSLALKLHRRMRISRMKPAGEIVTIAGRIYGTLGDDEVTIYRRESCTKDVEVMTVKPDADGRWRAKLPAPDGVQAATYRATTEVRKGDNPKRFRTFTLPGHVSL